ncbi:MAG: 3-deoxy-manno-octulosonate cytidylyltransferase [Fidelibacterota bacterium]
MSKSAMSVLGVIPARYGSARFPGKPLILIGGIPMINRVARQAQKTKLLDRLIVATDDDRIAETIRADGYEALLTSPDHVSGSDRLLEVAEKVSADIYVNIQGDEPFIDPDTIDKTVSLLISRPELDVATTAVHFTSIHEWQDSNRVKVLCDDAMNVLCFSRLPIPRTLGNSLPPNVFRHVGLYVYRKDVLRAFGDLPVHPVEKEESLEQLRLLMAGFHFGITLSNHDSPSVDVPEDVKHLEQWMHLNGFE